MEAIIMYVFLLSNRWDIYAYAEDPMITQEVRTLDDCAREADRLMERRGDITSWVCYQGGKPGHLILPPYEWPKTVWSTTPECDVYCTVELMKEEEEARERARQRDLETETPQ